MCIHVIVQLNALSAYKEGCEFHKHVHLPYVECEI